MRAMEGHPADVLTMVCSFANDFAEEFGKDPNTIDKMAEELIAWSLHMRDHALGEHGIDAPPTHASVARCVRLREAWKKDESEDES